MMLKNHPQTCPHFIFYGIGNCDGLLASANFGSSFLPILCQASKRKRVIRSVLMKRDATSEKNHARGPTSLQLVRAAMRAHPDPAGITGASARVNKHLWSSEWDADSILTQSISNRAPMIAIGRRYNGFTREYIERSESVTAIYSRRLSSLS